MDADDLLKKRPTDVSLEVLDPEHYHVLVKAVRNILSTKLAESGIAQLIDGLPLMVEVFENQGCLLRKGHPMLEHDKLCEGAIEQATAFRNEFDPSILHFSSRVMQAYQSSKLGSREFKMRLVELTAMAVHNVAAVLYQHHPKLHNQEDIDATVSWTRPPRWIADDGLKPRWEKDIEPHPTLFYHIEYMDHDRYTHGLADVAGYWAEDRIFGGVVLFDRGTTGLECNDIYFHSGRVEASFRIWRLTDSQFDGLVDFLLSDTDDVASPSTIFPILPSKENRHRHDPWDAIALHNIYRDPWERKYPDTKPEERDVRTIDDYPEVTDAVEEIINSYNPRDAFDVTVRYDDTGFPTVVPKRARDAEPDDDDASQTSSIKRRKVEEGQYPATPPPLTEDALRSLPPTGSPPPLESPPPRDSPAPLSSPPLMHSPSSPKSAPLPDPKLPVRKSSRSPKPADTPLPESPSHDTSLHEHDALEHVADLEAKKPAVETALETESIEQISYNEVEPDQGKAGASNI